MKIIDDFLPEEEFNSIQSLLMGYEFTWFYQSGAVKPDDGQYQMCHMFFQPDVGPNCDHIDMWNNFMIKIGAKQCKRIKANLSFKTDIPEYTLFHCDYPDIKTAIFYINTNNGYTEFQSGVRVSSVANRVCIFDSNLKHRGVTPTEGEHQRVVVNFNYA